jgi:TolB-like protein
MLSASCLLLLAVAAAPSTSTPTRPKVLVHDLRNDGVDPKSVSLIRDSIATELSGDNRIEVVSVEEVRRVLRVEGEKTEAGCDVDSAACQAEIAQALGARYLVTGNVGVLGDLTIINLTLADMTSAATLVRKQVEVRAAADIPHAIRSIAPQLLEPIVGASTPELPPLVWIGGAGAALGAVTGVVGLGYGMIENGSVPASSGLAAKKRADAESTRNVSYVVAAVGAVVAAVGVGGIFLGLSE